MPNGLLRRLFCRTALVFAFGLVFSASASAEVVLKMMVTNPSETEVKEYDIRSPLPPEVKSEHVLDSDGLRVEYDSQGAAYLLVGHVTLKPRESMTKQIVLEDVWVIGAQRFSSLRRELEEIMRKLTGTPYFERGDLLAKAVERRLVEVQESQDRAANAPPMEHINQYRENLKTLDQVETDLVSLRQLMVMAALNPASKTTPFVPSESAASSAGEGEGGSLTRATTLKLIFIIIGLLGFVSLSFFWVWQRQLKMQLAKQAQEGQASQKTASAAAEDPLNLPPAPPAAP